MTRTGRENNFVVLRLCAAIMVISGHMANLMLISVPMLFQRNVHALGVYIFFMIGGYLITKSWMSDPHPVRYAVKRFMRIWPPLAVFVLFAAFVAGPLLSTFSVQEYFLSGGWKYYLWNIALYIMYSLPGVFTGNPYPNAVNGSLWTLPVEAAMYIVVPLLLTLCAAESKTRRSKTCIVLFTALVCILDGCLLAFFPDARLVFYGTDWVSALHNIPFYLIGVVCAVIDIRRYLSLQVAMVLVLLLSCMKMNYVKMQFVLYAALPYLVFSLAFTPQAIFSKLNQKAEISYGMYLYGFFIQQCVMAVSTRMGWQIEFMTALVISCIFTVGIAYASYYLVERPAQKLCSRILEKCR